jgi:hypothetical protein
VSENGDYEVPKTLVFAKKQIATPMTSLRSSEEFDEK